MLVAMIIRHTRQQFVAGFSSVWLRIFVAGVGIAVLQRSVYIGVIFDR